MPDDPKPETTATDPKPDEKTPPAAATAPPAAEPKPDPKPDDEFDKDRAMDTIRTQREAEKALKAKLKDAEARAAKADEYERAQLSDQEKLQKELDEAQAKAENATGVLQRANLIAELAKPEYGIVDAKAASKLIEDVEYDDSGEPTNLGKLDEKESLIATFLDSHDFLRGTPGKPRAPRTDAREGGGDDKKPDLTAEELEMARATGMTPEEYAAFKKGGSLADLKEAGLVTEPAK